MAFTSNLLGPTPTTFVTGKAVCVGRNYAEHAAELNNPIPIEPLLFIKPRSALRAVEPQLSLSTLGPVHYETELVLLIGKTLCNADEDLAFDAIKGIGLGLDLTLRELQSELKKKGHPWEKAKAFDGSGIVTDFVSPERLPSIDDIHFSLEINDHFRQQGHSTQMLTPIPALLRYISRYFTLNPGDLVFTGTPAGVGVLQDGERLKLRLENVLEASTTVCI